ncbi:coiled-coil domain containing 96 [Rhinolophus ferrumequinum]|uniref:Coiled-coil domain containing 96 n=1 Tax=Rhinolophus ferrumequinum TaxID=59479 RepID=A0A671E5G8_RHIFE|nr:coiled-coil domain-containing protein 96 [Rhinolophus ferrumequinum]KAF6371497.1 coiled-coil domain containing 96 [Rhinolophus ferrumequinum]
MDSHSEHTGDPEQEDRHVESLAARLSEITASSGSQSPADTAEPEPQPETIEAAEGGVAVAEPAEPAEPTEPAEPREGPEATEAAGKEGPGEREWPTEAEQEEVAEAGPEEPAKPESEGGPEEPEEPEEEEREEEAEERRKEAPSRSSLPLSTTGQEEAATVPEAEREGREEEVKEDESEGKSVGGSPAKSELELERHGLDEGLQEGLEWTEEVQKAQERQLRTELLEQYRSLVVERGCYQRYNIYLQQKISDALRRKKGLDTAEGADRGAEPESTEKEEAYFSHLAVLEELRKHQADDLDWYHQELDQLKLQCEEKLTKVDKAWRDFQALKKQVMLQAMGSCRMRGGRQAALREVEQIQALEDKKQKEMSAVRLENVQLRQGLVHFDTRMSAQEDMAGGLLLIDFEQLKIENQTFNEKVEERNEELLKLRKKVNNNVQIITHVKEKLHFMELENAGRKSQLLDIETQVALKRDILTKTKQARDSLRVDNIKLNLKSGLLGKESLLRDLEEKVGKTEGLRQRLESLKHHHAGLTLSCRGVRQKIREARAFLPR